MIRTFAIFSSRKITASLFFALVFLFKLPIIKIPCHWDDLTYLGDALVRYKQGFGTLWFKASQGWNMPFFYDLLASVWSVFGYSIWISHLVVIIFSFLGVYFTYLSGVVLKDNKTGLIAALLLFFSPLYFAQSGTINLDLPLTVFVIMGFYFYLKGKVGLYFLFASCAALTKVSGLILPASLIVYELLKRKKTGNVLFLRKIFVHFGIIIIFLIFAIFSKYDIGGVSQRYFYQPATILGFLQALLGITNSLFYEDYRILLTFCLAIAIFLKFKLNKFRMILCDGNIQVIIFLSLAILSLAAFKSRSILLPRYLLICYPFYFIIGASCLTGIIKKYNYLFCLTVIMLLLSISRWYGYRSDVGYLLETNMEYLDQIKTHKLACKFIEDNYPKAMVVTGFPQRQELLIPELGYISFPIDRVHFLNFKGQDKERPYLVYYSSQSGNQEKFLGFMKKHNLIFLKSYESNGKAVSIYEMTRD